MDKFKIRIGMASCGTAAGAGVVKDSLVNYIKEKNIDIELEDTACIGMCYAEPIVEFIDGDKSLTYGDVNKDNVIDILEAFQAEKPIKENIIIANKYDFKSVNNLGQQKRIVLRNVGTIDPESIKGYLANDGYKALKKALDSMSQEEVIAEIKDSGLRGRGGAGFPTGLKWQFANQSVSDKKYMVCNADEGDPGAFMDRSVLEGDPHSVLEGMAIAAYAIGADEGYLYVRAEYPLAIKHLRIAIDEAEKLNYLGKNIFGTDFNFELHIKEGAGAFVCGEETALMASIEGERGMPRIRPPFPAQSGLWGKPTNINNVETLANIAWIILNGSKEYKKYGTEKSRGTK
ncbi:MAG: NADH-quinone oxidoreductase subunit F, partial [Candidatus Cloacimonadota bacterium]|nr:NADH-quinone oxidoreductase subunit F [Candidatus Cloacimonadota bacterium]